MVYNAITKAFWNIFKLKNGRDIEFANPRIHYLYVMPAGGMTFLMWPELSGVHSGNQAVS